MPPSVGEEKKLFGVVKKRSMSGDTVNQKHAMEASGTKGRGEKGKGVVILPT